MLSPYCRGRYLCLLELSLAHPMASPGGIMKIKPKLSASLVLLLVGCLSACTEPTQPIRAETDFVASATSSYAITDLGNLGGSFAVARGIDDAGQIVGVSETGAGQLHAFVWTIAPGMTDLGTLGGANSQAFSINEHGNIAGSSLLVSGERHAFLWTAAAGMQDLVPSPGATTVRLGTSTMPTRSRDSVISC